MTSTLLRPFALTARRAVVRIISGLHVEQSHQEIMERVAARPLVDQGAIVLSMLAALACASIVFSWAGPLAPVFFWMTLLAVIR